MEENKKKSDAVAPIKENLVSAPNYGAEAKWQKIKRRLNGIIVKKIANTPFQFSLYRSYWHLKLTSKSNVTLNDRSKNIYITQKPNYGAGIGHQLANWNSGLFFARYYRAQYAHSPFSTEKWEQFLGFGEGEILAADLEKNNGYKKVNLPRFDSENAEEVKLIGDIISSYKQKKILFKLEIDQGYMRQFDTTPVLSSKFFNASARKVDKLIFEPNCYNIAIHIRRRMKIETESVWKERGLDNDYYANVLRSTLKIIKTDKKIRVYFFSQGNLEDFPEFREFNDITYCLDMGPVESVLHMIYADLLIASKSSFSYKPALISKKLKICPQTFWHGYPDTGDFILADNNGNFDEEKLLKRLKEADL